MNIVSDIFDRLFGSIGDNKFPESKTNITYSMPHPYGDLGYVHGCYTAQRHPDRKEYCYPNNEDYVYWFEVGFRRTKREEKRRIWQRTQRSS